VSDVVTLEKSREEAIREGATAFLRKSTGKRCVLSASVIFRGSSAGYSCWQHGADRYVCHPLGRLSLVRGRRIEAVTGKGAIAYHRKVETTAKSIARELKADLDSVEDRVGALLTELDARQKEIGRLKEEETKQDVERAIRDAWKKDGVTVISMVIGAGRIEDLRKATDMIRSRVKTCVIVVGTKEDGKGMLVVSVSKDLQGRYHRGQYREKPSRRSMRAGAAAARKWRRAGCRRKDCRRP